ncbi:MAG: S53 family peptidase [bacterium]
MKIKFFVMSIVLGLIPISSSEASYHFANYVGRPPIHVYKSTGSKPSGVTPDEIKSLYHLPSSGGHGTIAIIGAYTNASIEKDLADFDTQFSLPACTTKNGCLEVHRMSAQVKSDTGWALETALDVEWAHAIAPNAHILLVSATTPSGANFLDALDYVSTRRDVSSVSMSWGGQEFPEEVSLDSHFVNVSGAVYFAASGDNGAGVSWPASSPNVVAVGGTTIIFDRMQKPHAETAWRGSGGGISAYEKAPPYQIGYSILKSMGMRAIPDVAYDADPRTGFPIVHAGLWRTVGGTSAGAPQWAALATLGSGASNTNFYKDKMLTTNGQYFTDITSGKNGACIFYCTARKRYDYVTGLGTPHTTQF